MTTCARCVVDVTDEPDPFVGGQHGINVLDSEGVFLSHCLMHPEQHEALMALLKPEHFYATCNQRVWEAYRAVGETKQPDVVLVANWMRSHGTLTQSGGTPYLATLVDCTPATANPALHAEQIREAWLQRELMACLTRVAIRLRGGDLDHREARRVLSEHFKDVKDQPK